jgi:hypothetical protein
MVRPSALERATIVALVFAATMAACTGSSGGADPSSAPASARPGITAIPSTPLPTTTASADDESVWPVDRALLDDVLDLAATASGVDRSTLVIVTAESVTWNDGSLGCPTPGSMYTQALVDGYRVVVAAGDRRLDYRMGRGGAPRLCEHPGPAGASGG